MYWNVFTWNAMYSTKNIRQKCGRRAKWAEPNFRWLPAALFDFYSSNVERLGLISDFLDGCRVQTLLRGLFGLIWKTIDPEEGSDPQKGGERSEGYSGGSAAGHLGGNLYGWVYTPIYAPPWLAPHLKLVSPKIQNKKGANFEETPGRPWGGLQGGLCTVKQLIGP